MTHIVFAWLLVAAFVIAVPRLATALDGVPRGNSILADTFPLLAWLPAFPLITWLERRRGAERSLARLAAPALAFSLVQFVLQMSVWAFLSHGSLSRLHSLSAVAKITLDMLIFLVFASAIRAHAAASRADDARIRHASEHSNAIQAQLRITSAQLGLGRVKTLLQQIAGITEANPPAAEEAIEVLSEALRLQLEVMRDGDPAVGRHRELEARFEQVRIAVERTSFPESRAEPRGLPFGPPDAAPSTIQS